MELHAKIVVRIGDKRYDTTVGRILFWEIMPKDHLMVMRHIMVGDKAQAQDIADQIEGGKDFLELVQTHSQSLDKQKDGYIGVIRKDEFIRIFETRKNDAELLFDLKEGDISPVIAIGDHFHIFQILEKRNEIPFDAINSVMDKGKLRDLVDFAYRNLGPKATVILSDRIKDIGYKYSTKGGLSISIDDMIIPEAKWDILKKAENQVLEISRQYTEGLITQGEKYNKVVDIWAKATDDVANEMMESMKNAPLHDEMGAIIKDENGQPVISESQNPIFMMADSGARGSKDQMRQLAGMRGLMAKPSGEIIETPVQANFREGLSVLQYFTSTHGARKGLADTALKTANSGYLTRRLADVAQDATITEHDCGTMMGVEVEPLMEGGEVIQRLGERVLGRVTVEDILDPFTDEVLIPANQEINERGVKIIEDAGITRVKIRSVLDMPNQIRCMRRLLWPGSIPWRACGNRSIHWHPGCPVHW